MGQVMVRHVWSNLRASWGILELRTFVGYLWWSIWYGKSFYLGDHRGLTRGLWVVYHLPSDTGMVASGLGQNPTGLTEVAWNATITPSLTDKGKTCD